MKKNISIIALLLLVNVCSIFSQTKQAQILVGPNIMVSSERPQDGTSNEFHVAADPTNPLNLLATGRLNLTQYLQGQSFLTARAYYSHDGGNSWNTIIYPEVATKGGGDPQVAYGRTGTGYCVILSDGGMGQLFYRSEDGGATWNKPVCIPFMDHQQIAVDHTNGRFAGNVYISGLISDDKNKGKYSHVIGVYRSTDDGRTWIGPVAVANSVSIPNAAGLNTSPALPLFSDGELFVPLHDFGEKAQTGNHYWFVTSKDGAATFSAPQKVTDEKGNQLAGIYNPVTAIDNSNSSFRDRIYVVWAKREYYPNATQEYMSLPGETRILISYSSDRGRTWSKPKMVAATAPDNSYQFVPTLAVNNEGTVAVAWYDTRETAQGSNNILVHQYVSASIDGGETFLPAVRVSSEPSDPTTIQKNFIGATGTGVYLRLTSGEISYGDYYAMVASSDGTFHPVWVDGRTGSGQMWTAKIRVERSDKASAASALIETDVSNLVEVVLDPLRPFPTVGTIEWPVRLRNKSNKPIYGPIKVEVTQVSVPSQSLLEGILLNANNGKSGVGATMDYKGALGNFESLMPGAISEGIIWRFKVPIKATDFQLIQLKVTASVEQLKSDEQNK